MGGAFSADRTCARVCVYLHYNSTVDQSTPPHLAPVVKVRGLGAQPPLLPFEPPCNSMSPLIESIKCYFMPK